MTSTPCATLGESVDGSETSVDDYPGVSVVMPVLNEEQHLAAALRGIIDQDYPGPLEIVMAVGPSTDRTREIADELARDLSGDGVSVRVVDSPTGKTPASLNLAIAASQYDYLVRVDGHGELTDHYIATAVDLLQRTGAANVGGIMDAQGRSPFEQAVAAAYTSRLGLGGSRFHLHDSPEGPAETVFLGSFRRDALEAAGGFDETMFRAQDWDLNHRLRQAGETVYFTPRMRVIYRPRSTLKALLKQFYDTGKWRREVIRRYPETASVRYLAPPAAVAVIAAGTAAGVVGLAGPRWLRLGFLAPLGYLAAVGAGTTTLKRPLSPAARAWLPVVVTVMHMAWGAGFLVGLRGTRPIPPEPTP